MIAVRSRYSRSNNDDLSIHESVAWLFIRG